MKIFHMFLMVQLRVGCHAWPNTTEYTADYSKQNETDLTL